MFFWEYAALFGGTFLAATIVPFSSEILFTTAILSHLSPITTVIVATLGNLLGGITGYYLGYLGRWEWLEKYFRISHESIVRMQPTLKKYGMGLAFFSWLPVIGDPFCIAMGFMRTPWAMTFVLMLLGKTLRYIVLAYLLLQYGVNWWEVLKSWFGTVL